MINKLNPVSCILYPVSCILYRDFYLLPYGSILLIFVISALATNAGLPSLLFRDAFLLESRWRFQPLLLLILPVPVIFNLFAALLFVFNFIFAMLFLSGPRSFQGVLFANTASITPLPSCWSGKLPGIALSTETV